MKLIQNDCGLHWGKGGRCAKCSSGVVSASHARNQNLIAALEPLPRSIQERAIIFARNRNNHNHQTAP